MKKQFTWKTSSEKIKLLKIYALNQNKNANEILDDALDKYLKEKEVKNDNDIFL